MEHEMPIKMWPSRNLMSVARFIILVAILGICLVYCFAIISLKYDKTLGNSIGSMLESLNWHFDEIIGSISRTRQKPFQFRKVNLRSVGCPNQEAELLEVRHWVYMYKLSFGKLPERSSDFERMTKEGSLDASQKSLIKGIARKCQIFAFGSDSYLLNCDGARLQGDDDLHRLIHKFDQETEKFYVSDSHIFLYAPAPVAMNRPAGGAVIVPVSCIRRPFAPRRRIGEASATQDAPRTSLGLRSKSSRIS